MRARIRVIGTRCSSRLPLARGTAASVVREAGAKDLEDAFVRLVSQATDNFEPAA